MKKYKGEALYDDGIFYEIAADGNQQRSVYLHCFYNPDFKSLSEFIYCPSVPLDAVDLVSEIQDIILDESGIESNRLEDFQGRAKRGYFDDDVYILPFSKIDKNTPDGLYYSPHGFIGNKAYALIKRVNRVCKFDAPLLSDIEVLDFYEEKEKAVNEMEHYYNDLLKKVVTVISKNEDSCIVREYSDESRNESHAMTYSYFVVEVPVDHSVVRADSDDGYPMTYITYGIIRNGIVPPTCFKTSEEAKALQKTWSDEIKQYYGFSDEEFEDGLSYYADPDGVISEFHTDVVCIR